MINEGIMLQHEHCNQKVWIQLLSLPFTSCVTLEKLRNCSVPPLPHLVSGDNNST